MDHDTLWALVEATRPADGDCDRHAGALTTELCKLPPDEIVAFHHLLRQLYDDAGTQDLFAAACLLNAKCFGGVVASVGRDG